MLIESIYIVMNNPLNIQIGGSHYESSFQPVELFAILNFNSFQANVFKYAFRHKDKNGLEDLDKGLHYSELAKILKPKNFARYSTEAKDLISLFCEVNNLHDGFKEFAKSIVLQEWDSVKFDIEEMIKDYMSDVVCVAFN